MDWLEFFPGNTYFNFPNCTSGTGSSLVNGVSVENFERAIELDPDYTLAYTGRGLSYHLLGQYEKAIELDPVGGRAYYWRGKAHAQLGNSTLSAKDAAKAKELRYTP